MALTPAQLITVAEITGEFFEVVEFYSSTLNSDQETAVGEEIDAWSEVRDNFTVIDGDGVRIDPADRRAAIRRRVRLLFHFEDAPAGSVLMVRG